MRAEYFDLTLTVPVVVRFLCAGLRGVFFAPGGRMRAAGLLRVGLCARLSQHRGRAGARGGRSASRAKAPGTSPGASFLSPLSLAIQRKGAQGRRGRAAPEDWRGDSRRSALRRRQNSRKRCGTRSVLRYDTRSIATRHATSLQTPESPPGQTLGGGRATFGPPLQHRLYQERNSQSPIFSIFSGHTLRDSTRLR